MKKKKRPMFLHQAIERGMPKRTYHDYIKKGKALKSFETYFEWKEKQKEKQFEPGRIRYEITEAEYYEIKALSMRYLKLLPATLQEETHQDIALKVACHFNPHIAKLSTFVLPVAKNTVYDRLRKLKREKLRNVYAFTGKEWERVEAMLVRQETGRTPSRKTLEHWDEEAAKLAIKILSRGL
ncbi:hypothetical protein L0152_30895 [bacterium]|nr:hypothetical protein [bacterium]